MKALETIVNLHADDVERAREIFRSRPSRSTQTSARSVDWRLKLGQYWGGTEVAGKAYRPLTMALCGRA